jgi:hypothetical protein
MNSNSYINSYTNSYIQSNKEIHVEIIELIYYFGKIFHYKEAIIFHRYTTFNFLLKDKNNIFTSFNLFNITLYNYLKNGSQYLSFNPFITYNIGYWYLDEYFNKLIESNIIDNVKMYLIGGHKHFNICVNCKQDEDNDNDTLYDMWMNDNITNELEYAGWKENKK